MSVPVITVVNNGSKLDPAIEILSLQVTRELNRVPTATLILLDGSLAERCYAISNHKFFLPGSPISIALRYEGNSQDTIVFEGLVVRHAVEQSGASTSLRIELKDSAFLLTRNRRSAVYRDISEGDVFQILIRAAGLSPGTIEVTPTQQSQIVQYNSSDWDFLLSRAEAQGLGVVAHRGEVSVRRIGLGTPRRKLDVGLDDVAEVALELDGRALWASITGMAWDEAVGAASSPIEARDPGLSVGNLNTRQLAEALGGGEENLLHPVVLDPGELQDWTNARLLRSRFSLLRGRALLAGDALLEPLDTVEIQGVGDRFNGQALVSVVTHTVDRNGWQSEIRLGLPPEPFASQPDLADLPAAGLLPPVRGLQIATVGKLEDDPQGGYRVKVRLPALPEDQGDLWARLACPEAGKDRGFAFRPEEGDEVVVAFLNDDPRQPVVLGALHSGRHPPPSPVAANITSNDQRALVSRAGTRIVFDDGKPALTLETTADGSTSGVYRNRIRIDQAAHTISIEDEHGNAFQLGKDGISLSSVKDTIIKATGKVVIQASSIDLQP